MLHLSDEFNHATFAGVCTECLEDKRSLYLQIGETRHDQAVCYRCAKELTAIWNEKKVE
jgi:hypothetical protein